MVRWNFVHSSDFVRWIKFHFGGKRISFVEKNSVWGAHKIPFWLILNFFFLLSDTLNNPWTFVSTEWLADLFFLPNFKTTKKKEKCRPLALSRIKLNNKLKRHWNVTIELRLFSTFLLKKCSNCFDSQRIKVCFAGGRKSI